MSRSFDRLMEYFSLEQREKEQKVEEIFHETLEFFKYFKHVQSKGTDKEKEIVQKKLLQLQEKYKQEADKSMGEVKLSRDDVKEITADKKNFNPEQWEFIQTVKKVYDEEKAKITKEKQEQKSSRLARLKTPKGATRKTRGKKWLKP